MLGRGRTESPQFISMSDGSWLGTWAYIERMTAISSACRAVRENNSLISKPDSPCRSNLNGDGSAAPVLRSVASVLGTGLPAYRASAGLGSNVSTCEGPPLRKKWITRLARAGKCGVRGRSGPAGADA